MECPLVVARKLGEDGLIGAADKKEEWRGRAIGGVRTTIKTKKER